jgi:hypothetical protein
MKRIHVGSRVRIANGAVLAAALRGSCKRRPEPAQMVCADRTSSVTAWELGASGRFLYELKDAPGRWPEEWIDPV